MWKAVFVLKTFDLCPNLLVMQENGLIRKLRPISKFMTSERGKQIIVIYILLNIWRSKGNRAMKFGKLIEYNMRNIFFKKSYIHSVFHSSFLRWDTNQYKRNTGNKYLNKCLYNIWRKKTTEMLKWFISTCLSSVLTLSR